MKSKIPIITFLFVLIIFSQRASNAGTWQEQVKATTRSNNYALIVGINDWSNSDPKLTHLPNSEKAARNFFTALLSNGWNKDNITLLTGSKATYDEITRTINNLVNTPDADEESTILFFFTGHGFRSNNRDYVIPCDAMNNANKNLYIDWIEQKFDSSGFGRKLLFIEACRGYSGMTEAENQLFGITNSSTSKSVVFQPVDSAKSLRPHMGLRTLLSAERGYVSRNGVISNFISDGISGKADYNGDKVVVIGELELYLAEQTEKWSKQFNLPLNVYTHGECDPMVPITVVERQTNGQQTSGQTGDQTQSYTLDQAWQLSNNGKPDEALKICESYLKTDPNNISALEYAGWAHYKKKEYENALAYYTKVINNGIKNCWIYEVIGLVYLDQKQYETAETYFNDAEGLDQNDPNPHLYLGECHYNKQEYNDAINEFKRAIDINSSDDSFYCWRGCAYYGLKNYTNALSDWNKAIELDPKHVWAYSNIGDYYYYIAKDNPTAKTWYQKALDADPNYDHARNMLEAIK